MLSKLKCINFQIMPKEVVETDFERYIRERSEQILKKCFKIKISELKLADDHDTSKEKENSYEKMLPQPTVDEKNTTKLSGSGSKASKSIGTDSDYMLLNAPSLQTLNESIQEMELLGESFENLQIVADASKRRTLDQNSDVLKQTPLKTQNNNIKKEMPPLKHGISNSKSTETSKRRPLTQKAEFLNKQPLQTTRDSIKKEMDPLKNGISQLKTAEKPKRRPLSQNSKYLKQKPQVSTATHLSSKTIKKSNTKIWKSSFNSSITLGTSKRSLMKQQFSPFQYDLSREEQKFTAVHFRSPMKPAPEAVRQLLASGQRREYLEQRYEHSPVVKYNYPEATSWRIGWLHQQQQHQPQKQQQQQPQKQQQSQKQQQQQKQQKH